MRPKRLGVADVDAALGGQPGVADGMGAAEAAERMIPFQLFGETHLLHDLQLRAQAQDFGAGVGGLDDGSQLGGRGLAGEDQAQQVQFQAALDVFGRLAQGRFDFLHLAGQVFALGKLDPRHQLALHRLAVHGGAGRIRASAFQGLQHPKHGLAQVFAVLAFFIEETCDPAHQPNSMVRPGRPCPNARPTSLPGRASPPSGALCSPASGPGR